MSECVVRMEMPTENTVCELNYYSGLYREWRCTITDKRCGHNKNGMFPSWCPILCQLPAGHGRLVDADEDVSNYITVWDCNCSEFGKQTVMAVDDMQYLPTIVPAAERSNE